MVMEGITVHRFYLHKEGCTGGILNLTIRGPMIQLERIKKGISELLCCPECGDRGWLVDTDDTHFGGDHLCLLCNKHHQVDYRKMREKEYARRSKLLMSDY